MTTAKKWVDYSDSSDEDPPQRIPPARSLPQPLTQQFQADNMERLGKCSQKTVWIVLDSQDQRYLQNEAEDMKKNTREIIEIYVNRGNSGWEVLIERDLALKWIEKGYDSTGKMSVKVSQSNLQQKKTKRKFEEKKKYISKETDQTGNYHKKNQTGKGKQTAKNKETHFSEKEPKKQQENKQKTLARGSPTKKKAAKGLQSSNIFECLASDESN